MKLKFLALTLGVIASIFLFAFNSSKLHVKSKPDATDINKFDASVFPDWQDVSQENWSLFLPPGSWEAANTGPIPDIKLAFKDHSKECMVVLLKQNDDDSSLAEYVRSTIRVADSAGILLLEARQLVINGTEFIVLKMNHGVDIIWSWITIKNGFGYNLSCEQHYQMDAGSNQKLCYAIANTFQIK